jgi:DNA-binding NarL/FixJ family response regulator
METEEPGKTSVLVVAAYPLLRHGAVAALEATRWATVCGETGEAAWARQLCIDRQPELAVVDLELEDGDGLALLREFAGLRRGIGLLALTEREDSDWVRRIFDAGAHGTLSNRDITPELPAALWHIYMGRNALGRHITASVTADVTGKAPPRLRVEALSNRELEVLRRVAAGKGPSQIAGGLGVAVTTVETHLSRIKTKLGLRNGEELKRAAARWAMGAR